MTNRSNTTLLRHLEVLRMNSLSMLDWVALVLVIVGGVNWGLVALMDLDLVAMLFGDMTMVSRIVYGLVGASAVYMAVVARSLSKA